MNAPHLGIELLKIFVKRLRSANERIMALSSGREKQS
jgi:CRP-like cAMP-binding protein